MANTSNWKGWEWDVAKALGGKRRLRTMESYGKEAPDVYFPRAERKKHPLLKTISVECKKRRAINVHTMFLEAKMKYGFGGKNIILATKVSTSRASKRWRRLKKKLKERTGHRLRRKDFIMGLVTVELGFFKDIFGAYLRHGGHLGSDT